MPSAASGSPLNVAQGALDMAGMNGMAMRWHWAEPTVSRACERWGAVFVVLDGAVGRYDREVAEARIATPEAGDIAFAASAASTWRTRAVRRASS